MDYTTAIDSGRIELLDETTDAAFLSEVLDQVIDHDTIHSVSDDFKIVYTPFNGCGWKMVPEVLTRFGVKHLYTVPEQGYPDGSFPTLKNPNPEVPDGFNLAEQLADKVGSDLLLGTDPDSDRVAVMVRDKQGFTPITGNQMGVLLLDYIIEARNRTNTMPESPAAVTTIVSTPMYKKVCMENDIRFDETFTGFKFMAEKIAEYGNRYSYLLAFEESIGYMMGDYVRDKDAVTAALIIIEMASWWKAKGLNLLEALAELYKKYGFFREETVNLFMYGVNGMQHRTALMEKLRNDPPKCAGSTPIVAIRDYADGTVRDASGKLIGNTPIKGSNVLYFELADGSNIVVRPSGTEPKIKMYVLALGTSLQSAEERVRQYTDFVRSLAPANT